MKKQQISNTAIRTSLMILKMSVAIFLLPMKKGKIAKKLALFSGTPKNGFIQKEMIRCNNLINNHL